MTGLGKFTGGTKGDHSDVVNAVAFSSDGGLLASASADRTVRLWNPNTRALLRGLPVKAGTVPLRQFISVAFSPEGDLLAAGNENGSVYVWNPRTRQQTATLTLPTDDGAYGLAFTQNGSRLAVAYQSGVVAIWDVLVKRSVKQLAYGLRTEMQAAFQVAYSASMPGPPSPTSTPCSCRTCWPNPGGQARSRRRTGAG